MTYWQKFAHNYRQGFNVVISQLNCQKSLNPQFGSPSFNKWKYIFSHLDGLLFGFIGVMHFDFDQVEIQNPGQCREGISSYNSPQ